MSINWLFFACHYMPEPQSPYLFSKLSSHGMCVAWTHATLMLS